MTTKNRFTFFNVKKSFFKHLTKTIIPCIAFGIIISESFYPAWYNSSNTGVGVHLDTVLIKKNCQWNQHVSSSIRNSKRG